MKFRLFWRCWILSMLGAIGVWLGVPSAQAQYGDLERRIQALEEGRVAAPGCCLEDCCPLTGRLDTLGSRGPIFYADFLYWTVRNSGFEYGITQPNAVQDGGPVGQVESLQGNYAPAFRIGAGWRLGDCCGSGPEVLFSYTRFRNTFNRVTGPGRSTIISSDNAVNTDQDIDVDTPGIAPFPQNVTPEDLYNSAAAVYAVRYNAFDAVLSQTLALTDCMSIKFAGGGRYLDFGELKQVTYTGGDFLVPLTAQHTGRFNGAGIITGSQLRWNLLRPLSVNFGFNVGALMGDNRTTTLIPDSPDATIAPAHVLTTPTNVTHRETRIVPLLELNASVTYSRQFGNFLVSVTGGYEITNYFNLSDTRVFSDAFQEGQNSHILDAVTLDGFFARLALNY